MARVLERVPVEEREVGVLAHLQRAHAVRDPAELLGDGPLLRLVWLGDAPREDAVDRALRIVGVVWGGYPSEGLEVQVGEGADWQPVEICPDREDTRTWTLWEALWRPAASGPHRIALRGPAGVPQVRLDSGHYHRTVDVD